jgi:hypothetical protein
LLRAMNAWRNKNRSVRCWRNKAHYRRFTAGCSSRSWMPTSSFMATRRGVWRPSAQSARYVMS